MLLATTDVTGILDDSATFGGGIVLAIDALNAVKKFRNEELRVKTLKSFGGRLLLETENGYALATQSDVRLHSLRANQFWARISVLVLLSGFLFQLITRLLEIFEHT